MIAEKPLSNSSGVFAPATILIPVYGAAAQLRRCLQSLVDHLPEDVAVEILDDATPGDKIERLANEFSGQLAFLRYTRSPVNRGFVQTCNRGIERRERTGSDVLLLNSDTEVTAGFFTELQTVLYFSERHGVACPRSNDATIFSVPLLRGLPRAESYRIWSESKGLLPRYQVMPTAVGFCMLIRSRVLELFGSFDEAYGAGYNEENDFVCRINQYGYSAVAANWAFVFHDSSASFGSKRASLETKNRRLLVSRYPEYGRKVEQWVRSIADPVEYFLHLAEPHTPRIVIDLYHLESKHCGTSEFALRLLEQLRPLLETKFQMYIAINPEARAFFANEITGYRFYDERQDGANSFDLAFKPCQIFTWRDFSRMNQLAPRLCFTLLDIIAVRCSYLSDAGRHHIVRWTAELSDHLFSISAATRTDFEAYYGIQKEMTTIHLAGTNQVNDCASGGDYILVVGNSFAHKAVQPAADALSGAGKIRVLGGGNVKSGSSVEVVASGLLRASELRKLYSGARVVVYPSQYEGFGLPILEALSFGKPVIAFDTAATRETAELAGFSRLRLVSSFQELRAAVEDLSWVRAEREEKVDRSWANTAAEYREVFERMLSVPMDVELLRKRWAMIRAIDTAVGSF